MPIRYSIIYDCCVQRYNELGIQFDFDNNAHLQHPTSMEDIYKNFVYHSQNRSKGYAINFFKTDDDGNETVEAITIWNIIKNYEFDYDNNYDYLNLFNLFKNNRLVSGLVTLEKGKDIQFIELAKTCQCIKKYLNDFQTMKDFVIGHTFTSDARNNWSIFKRVADRIYNVGTELVPDFFKEQDCIIGREYLVKADIHVKRFFNNLYPDQSLNDKKVYSILLDLYNEADENIQRDVPPYKIDKLIYLIGEHYGNPNDSKLFAEWVLSCCQ